MKQIISGVISYKQKSWKGDAEFYFHSCDMTDCGYVTVMPYSIEVDIPDDFDPRADQVKILQAEKQKLMADFHARCTEIERKISELTALDYVAEAA